MRRTPRCEHGFAIGIVRCYECEPPKRAPARWVGLSPRERKRAYEAQQRAESKLRRQAAAEASRAWLAASKLPQDDRPVKQVARPKPGRLQLADVSQPDPSQKPPIRLVEVTGAHGLVVRTG